MRLKIAVDDPKPLSGAYAYQTALLQMRTLKSLRRALKQALTAQGLTIDEWLVLSVVAQAARQDVPMQVIAAIVDISPPQLTKAVSKLIKRHLIRQRKIATDIRNRRLVCTILGKRLNVKADAAAGHVLEEWLSPLNQQQAGELLTLLAQLRK